MSQTMSKPHPAKQVSFAVVSMIFIGTLFYFYEYFLRVTPSIMKTQIQSHFGLTEAAFGYLVAFYYYAYTPMQIPVGILMDRFGPKRVLTFACLLCSGGTLLFASTASSLLAHLAQFLIGLGSAFAYVGVLKISDDWLAPKYFAFMAGLCTTLGMIGAICGEMMSEFFVGIIGWQPTLFYAAVFGIAVSVLIWFVLRDNRQLHTATDTPLLSRSFLSGIHEVTRNRSIWVTGLIGCLTFAPICVFAGIWAPDYLATKGLSKIDAAFGSSLIFLGFAVGGPFWGYFSDRINSRRIPLIVGSFLSGLFMLAALWIPSSNPYVIYCLLLLTGFFSGVEIIIFAVGNDLVRSSICATAAAFINMMTMLGAVLLPPIIGMILDFTVVQGAQSTPSIHNYSLVLTVIPVGLLVAGMLSLLLKESYPRHAAH